LREDRGAVSTESRALERYRYSFLTRWWEPWHQPRGAARGRPRDVLHHIVRILADLREKWGHSTALIAATATESVLSSARWRGVQGDRSQQPHCKLLEMGAELSW